MSVHDTNAPQEQAPVATDTAPVQEDNSAAVDQTQADTPVVAEETAQVTPTDTASGDDDGFLGGKYKTKEDFEKAYRELQTLRQTEREESANLSRILSEAFSTDQSDAVPMQPIGLDDEDEPQTGTAPSQLNPVMQKLAVMEFAMSYPDADGALMTKILSSDPVAAQIQDYSARLKYAYALSKTQQQPQVVEAAQKQAQAEAVAKVAEKQAAQVESAGKQAAPPTEEPLTPNQIHAAISDGKSFDDLLKKHYPGISSMFTNLK